MWSAKNDGGYPVESFEWNNNVTEIDDLLRGFHEWALVSVCGVIGNASGESGLNPWNWEDGYEHYAPTIEEFNLGQANARGYGLFQYTPPTKYINDESSQIYQYYSPNFYGSAGTFEDGHAQLAWLVDNIPSDWSAGFRPEYKPYLDAEGIDYTTIERMTLDQFMRGVNAFEEEMTLDESTLAFLLHYERPRYEDAASSFETRKYAAEKAWETITTDPKPERRKRRKWKFYLFM